METVEVVVKIPKEIYNHTQEYEVGGFNQENDAKLFMAIKNGTVLPKGHDRLIDTVKPEILDKAIKALKQQPSDDCISRQEALNVVHKYFEHYLQLNDDICLDGLRSLPSVTLEEKIGHWIDDEFGSKCSCCGIHTHLDKFDRSMKFKYCSMCGARMNR